MATSYANAGGSGDRTATITVTTTATIGGGTVNNWVDGVTASHNASDAWWWNNGQSGREVKFDFGSGKIIDEVKFDQQTTASHGTWKWQGSNDNSSFTDIGSTFTLGGSTNQTNTTMSGNTTSYRYYKLLQTAGTTDSGPWLDEITFKIDAGATEVDVPATTHSLGLTMAVTLATQLEIPAAAPSLGISMTVTLTATATKQPVVIVMT